MADEDGTDHPRQESFELEDFGPTDFEAMSLEEWEEAFDPDTWVTGPELLDRVESELRHRIASRDVFAVIERITNDDELCLLAYSDEGYALVRPSGAVEGFGTVLRDVKPTVALCSIPEYEPDPAEADLGILPDPAVIDASQGDFGNKILQAVSLALAIGGIVLIGGWIFLDVPGLGAVFGFGFLLAAGFLLFTVANARLSQRYRAEAYRERLRSVGLGEGKRPDFLPEDESGRTR